MVRFAMLGIIFGMTLSVSAAVPSRNIDITAPDGIVLKATYYGTANPGPVVLLLHMCNSNRKAWEPVARQLSSAGINALTLDYRGFGESAGERFEDDAQKQQKMRDEKWPGDIDAAFAYLAAQSGVDKSRIGVAGGSCGVNQAVQFARRHPEVKSVVLLAGSTNREGLNFLQQATFPIFTAAAADDQYIEDAPGLMKWMADLSGNSQNRFLGFETGKHGTEIFGPHPELPQKIVAWYEETLKPPAAGQRPALRKTPASEIWPALNEPALNESGLNLAERLVEDVRRRDPKANPVPELVVAELGYERLQAGQATAAIQLFRLWAEIYPSSANAYDSLGDAYLAGGENRQALEASRKALELLPGDHSPESFKTILRKDIEQKIEKLTAKHQ